MKRILSLITFVILLVSGNTFGQVPNITSLSTYSGKPGDTIGISGSNFNSTPGNNIVYFGATRATVLAASSTTLSVVVPNGVTYLPVSVLNTGNALTGYSNYPFLQSYDNSIYYSGMVNFDGKVDFGRTVYSGNVTCLAIGDLDGDGKPDMVSSYSSNGGINKISIYRNISTVGTISASSFAANVDFILGSQASSVAVGDLDGDGKLDIVVGNGSVLTVLRNITTTGSISTASFATGVNFSIGSSPKTILIRDLDGDGKPDLIAGGTVLRNTSTVGSINTGSFSSPVSIGGGITSIADIDGDGKPDMIYCTLTGVYISRNIAALGLISSASFSSPIAITPFVWGGYNISVGDIDGDGKPDVIVYGLGNSISIYRNIATAGSITSSSFAVKVDFNAGSSTPLNVGLGDMDGDGKPDIIFKNYNTLSVFRNISSLGSITTASLTAQIDFPTDTSINNDYYYNNNNIIACDLDGDKKADIITAVGNYYAFFNNQNCISVLHNNPICASPITGLTTVCTGTTTTLTDATLGGSWSSSNSSIATISSTGNVSGIATGTAIITYNTGIGCISTTTITITNSLPPIVGSNNVCVGSSILLTDIAGGIWSSNSTSTAAIGSVNGIVTAISPGIANITYSLGTGCIATTSVNVNPVGGSPIITSVSPSIGIPSSTATISGLNFNTVPGSNIVSFGPTHATVSASTPTALTVTVPIGATYMPVSVLNTNCALYGNSQYPFNPIYNTVPFNKDTINLGDEVDFATKAFFNNGMAIADFDGDGKTDVAIIVGSTGTVTIYRNTSISGLISTSSFAPGIDFDAGESPTSLAVGDIDGDGKADLIIGGSSHSFSVLRNTATIGTLNSRSFAQKVSIPLNCNVKSMGIGDFDGDGKLDLAIVNGDSIVGSSGRSALNTISIYRNISTCGTINNSSFDPKVDFNAGTFSTSIVVYDIDGDGKLEIIIKNSNSTFSIYRNTATSGTINSGSFASKVDFSTSQTPNDLKVGDLDGDGKPEIIILSGSNTLSLYKNASHSGSLDNTSFAAAVDFVTGNSPASVAIGDLNGDDKPDIAVGHYNDSVSIFRNTTTPGNISTLSLSTKIDYRAPCNQGFNLCIADIDGDMKQDLIGIISCGNTFFVRRNVPLLPFIIGNTSVCVGSATNLSDSSTGGVWTSSNPARANIGSSSGIVMGVAAGTAIITYSLAGSFVTTTVTVNPAPNSGTISGPTSVCVGSFIGLSDVATGGLWSSPSANVTVSGSTITGVTAGTAVISYTVSNSCGISVAIKPITVNPIPNAGTISGSTSITVGGTTTLTNSVSGGVWSSSNTSIATIGSNGLVTGIATGTSIISYGFTNSCGTAYATLAIHIVLAICPSIISTIAGNGTSSGYSGDGGPASVAQLNFPTGIAIDTLNNIYVCDWSNNRIRKISSSGNIVTIAGTGTMGYSGDGGFATAANIQSPNGITIDRNGNIYFSQAGSSVIRKINSSGIISTIAGIGFCSYSGDNGPATLATLCGPAGVATDRIGNIYIAEQNGHRIRKIDTFGVIRTVAGTGFGLGSVGGFSGDGGPATSARLNNPYSVAVDVDGNIYIADRDNFRVRKVDIFGNISTVVGNGTSGSTGDGGQATGALLRLPLYLAIGENGDLFISDFYDHKIRRINRDGIISTFAGNGTSGFNGDGGAATACSMASPEGIAEDHSGNLIIADAGISVLRKISNITELTPISGSSSICSGNSTLLVNSIIGGSWSSNNISIVSIGTSSGVILGISSGTSIITYSLSSSCFSTFSVSVNPLPNSGSITGASSICVGSSIGLSDATAGGVWSSASANVSVSGSTITGVTAGTSIISYTVTNSCGSAVATKVVSVNPLPNSGAISGPPSVCVGSSIGLSDVATGGVWSSPSTNVTVSGSTITGVTAGTAVISYNVANSCGISVAIKPITVNPIPNAGTITGASSLLLGATTTLLDGVSGGVWSSSNTSVASVGSTGLVTGVSNGTAIVSYGVTNGCGTAYSTFVITVSCGAGSGGIITSIAGGGFSGLGDGGPATAALFDPIGIAIDGSGNMYIADFTSYRVRKIDLSGIVTTIAGNGLSGFSGDGGPATSAKFDLPTGVAVDGLGNVYIADRYNNRIRKINLSGNVSTIAGNGIEGFSGDGGAATNAELNQPLEIAVDASGNIYIADFGNNRIRRVNSLGEISTFAGTGVAGFNGDNIPATAGQIHGPTGLVIDRIGNLFIADFERIRKINTSGVMNTIAGNGIPGSSGDGGPATSARLWSPYNIAVDGAGNVFIADADNNRIRKVDPAGVITTIAGNGIASYSGDGGQATAGEIRYPTCVTLDMSGNLYISDLGNKRIRKVTPNNTVLSITGTTSLCIFTTTTLNDATTGGTWSSNNTAVATISSTGIVNGVSAGTSIISYITPCGSATTLITVNTYPTVSLITGPNTLCIGSTITLTDTVSYGAWTSNNIAKATVNSTSGLVTGISAGTAIISYTVTNSCGSAVVTQIVSVNPGAGAGLISGPASLCLGANITLVDTNSGGVWVSGSTNATVGSSTGVVTGISAGTALISYIVSNSCGTSTATKVLSINTMPSVAAIGGASSVCAGANSTLTNATSGGLWTSTNLAIATVGSTTGIVHGVAAGGVIISYSVTNSCGSSLASQTMNVNASPSVGAISGSSAVCTGNTITLTDTSSGGVWSSSAVIRALVGSTGIVTGVTTGTAIISYVVNNACGSATATKIITINNSPSAGTITGAGTVGTFASIPLTDATTGGVWSSGTPAVATIGSTGIVTGVTPGTTIISYTVTNGCGTATATKTIVVTSSLASIVGASSVCPGGTTTLTDATPGGIWSSSDLTIASIGSLTGIVNGISTGTTIISYTVLGNTVTTIMSVSSSTPPIIGVTTVCTGLTTALSNASGGGAWTSSNLAKATVDVISGLVTGVTAGTAIISYTVSCGLATTIVIINSSPAPITGTKSVCQGSTTTLADITVNGSWSSSNPAIASVGTTGIVRGISGGTATISFTLGTGCSSTAVVTVNSLFSNTGITTVCMGQTTVINNPAPGGLWNSSNTAVATINCNLGIVKGVTPGTTIISYTLGSGCTSTIPVTVIILLPISGASGVCVAATTTLSNTSRGGAWISSDTTIATVDSASGVVTGIAPGNSLITYSFGTGCKVNKPITVLNLPSNTGANNVCIGATTTTSNIVSGGTWSSSNTAIATVVSASGLITGVSSGTTIITYRFGSTCIATTLFTVNPLPAAVTVSGGGTFCNNATITASGGGGETIYFQGTTINGTSTATPSTSQVVTTSGIYYFRAQSAAGCWGPQGSVTVLIPVITGPTTVCTGTTTTLANTGGIVGRWSSSNTAVGTVNATTGMVAGRTAGTTTIYDTLPSGCVVSTPLTVGSAPSINGASVVCIGQTITLTNTATGGTWSSSAPTIATVGSTGIVTGVAGGNRATITYALGATCRSTISVSVTANSPISVSGSGTVCVGQTISLTNPVTGGAWASSSTGVASVGTSGVVTGVSSGMATISYTLPSGCTSIATVSSKVLSPIIGPATVCVGQTITLVDTTDGGLWSTSAPTVATVGSLSGIVTGGAGNNNVTLTYTLGTGCKATKIVSVNPLTPIAGYSGTMCQVCQGLTVTLTDLTTGGTWSSSDPTIGSFSTGGILNGVGAGIVTVSYILPTGCITTLNAIVNPVAPIVGPSTVCLGQTIQLTESAGAGTWSSSAVTVATIGTTGLVLGKAANNSATITYTFCTGCTTTKVVSVNPLSVITGATSVCQGLITTMADLTPGGTWSSNSPGVLNFASTNGNVTGISAGTTIISYVLPTGCTSIMTMTVNPQAPILGPDGVCYQNTIALTNLVPGGAWSSAAAAIASVVASTGIVRGATGANNSTTITYTTSAGCKAYKLVSVYALPIAPPAIGGPTTVSISGAPITLTNLTTGGTWTSGNIGRATVVPSTGIVTGVGLGTVIITYTVANAAGCTNQVTKNIIVGPAPPPHIVTKTNSVTINVDATIALNEIVKGGAWSCNDCGGIVSINTETGVITGIATGMAAITYRVNDESGILLFITKVIVNSPPASVVSLNKEGGVYLIPNPNKGEFAIKGNLATTLDEDITMEIVDILGQSVYKGNTKAIEGKINEQVVLSNTLANGMYLLNLHSNAEHYVFHFVVER